MQVACLIPPDLEPASQDAGGGSPPFIVSAQPMEFAFPGPMILDHLDERTLSLEVQDADIQDTVFVQLYVDYNRAPTNQPTPSYANCQAPPNDTAVRLVPCDTNSLCNSIASTDQGDHVLEAMVADRTFILDSDPQAEGQPPYRALAEPQVASFNIYSWVMRCQPTDEI
jgi:hypothetical protein